MEEKLSITKLVLLNFEIQAKAIGQLLLRQNKKACM